MLRQESAHVATKLRQLAWSYYCPFNPDKKDEVLSFDLIRDSARSQFWFGLKLGRAEDISGQLNKLVGSSFEARAAAYRHRKVHRMEPRVMLRKPESPDQPSYMFAR